jgi:hypothetical protein
VELLLLPLPFKEGSSRPELDILGVPAICQFVEVMAEELGPSLW